MGDGPPASRRRDLIEADIRDVRRQLAEEELDAATAGRLIERYRQELDSVESGAEDGIQEQAGPGRSGRRLAGTLLLIGAVVAVSVTAYLAVRPREGGFVTGNMEAPVDLSEVTNDQMEAVIAANPDVPEIAAMRLRLADRYFESGEFSNALPHYLGALDGTLDRTRRARALARVGWMTFESGNAGIARAYLDEALAVDEGYVEAHLFLGLLLLAEGNAASALVHLEPLLEEDLPDGTREAIEQRVAEARRLAEAGG